MSGTALQSLEKRLRDAPRGSAELDAAIVVACDIRPAWLASSSGTMWIDDRLVTVGGEPVVRFTYGTASRHPGDPPIGGYPSFTSNLDAALKLVPDGLYWMLGYGRVREAEPLGGCGLMRPGEDEPFVTAEAHTVALAICVAAIKAKQTEATP